MTTENSRTTAPLDSLVSQRLRSDPLAIAEWCPIVGTYGKWIASRREWRISQKVTRSTRMMYLSGCRVGFSQVFSGSVWVRWGDALKCFDDPVKLSAFIEAVVG